MLNKKPQTIQGFLSPTKLLSAGFRSAKQNSKGPKSPIVSSSQKKQLISDSRYNSQNQSYLNTSREIENPIQQGKDTNISRLTGQNNSLSVSQPIEERRYESERNIPFTFDRETRNNLPPSYKNAPLPIEEEDRIYQSKQRTQSEINNYNTEKYRNQTTQQPFGQSKLRNDPTANFKQNFSASKSNLPEGLGLYSSIKGSNSQVMTVQCFELIRKLSKIKENLQLQISQLQTLLDNTSKHMDNMNEEFQKIKDSILAYTSKCLDTAFTEYKQNMVEWQKYEDFQRKSLVMLSEINQYIYNEEQNLSSSKNLSQREITTITQQLQRQIQYYRQFTDEIKKIREQCIGMRPTLTEDRIKQFERGLAILCNF